MKTIEELKTEKKLIESKITKILTNFEKEFGVKVDYTFFDNTKKFWETDNRTGPKKFKFDVEVD